MKIEPMMSRGIVLMHADGKFEMAPMQVFKSSTGQTVIRIGNNALFFDENGSFDGSECVCPANVTKAQMHRVGAAIAQQAENEGLAPSAPYFEPGSNGHAAETAAWKKS